MNLMRVPKVFYGWWIVLTAFITMVLSIGSYFSFGVFFKELLKEFSLSRAELSAVQSIQGVLAILIIPLIGRWIDSYGPRRAMMIGMVLLGICFILLSRLNALWQLYIIYVFIAVGLVATGPLPISKVISCWFDRRRGMALSFAFLGTEFGGFLLVPLSNHLISQFGWRISYFILGLLIWVITLPALNWLMKDSPEEMGLQPDGEKQLVGIEGGTNPPPSALFSVTERSFSPSEAIRTINFWLFSFAFFLLGMGIVFLFSHMVPFLTDKGLTAKTAAFILSLLFGFSAVGKIGMGFISDKYDTRYTMILICLIISTGMLILWTMESTLMTYIGSIIFGLGMGGMPVIRTIIIRENFGLIHFTEISGYIMVAMAIGSAISPFGAGYIFDITGSYSIAFFSGMTAAFLAAMAIFFAQPPKLKFVPSGSHAISD